ncbi:hypothetical protein EKI60_06405 [Candidatus Saccharibacteria bacterium]|nr:MAG: hypothetical protein EKI60_06405 [Candidatus Saccharibacteria bacterium]
MGFIVNEGREPTSGYINVLDPETNEVLAFPKTMSADDISQAISDDKNGTITQAKPNWYNDKVRPVLESTGMDMFQPKFLGAKVEADATRAFITSYAKEASFGLLENKNPEVQAITAESQQAHPIASWTGALVGQTQAIFQTLGIGQALGLGKFASKVGVSALEAGNVPVAKAFQSATQAGGVGALYGAITQGVKEVNKAVEENTYPDLVKVGKKALKDAGLFALYGYVGALVPSKAVGTATISGLAYTLAKVEGASETDALLNGAVMGIFHLASSNPKSLPDDVVIRLNRIKYDYIVAKNPAIHPEIARRTAQEHTMMVEDQIKAEKEAYNAKIAENVAKPTEGAVIEKPVPVVASKAEIIQRSVEDMLGVKPIEKPKEPVVEGKIAKASKDITDKLVSKGFEELLPEQQAQFTPITKEQQLTKVSELIKTDYEKAKNMALGKEPVTGDVNPQVVFNAVKNKALAEMDVETLRGLASSPIATERSLAAQELSASGFDNGIGEGDPVAVINKLNKVRKEVTEKKLGKTKVSKEKKDSVTSIKKSIKESVKKQDWEGFIKSLEC